MIDRSVDGVRGRPRPFTLHPALAAGLSWSLHITPNPDPSAPNSPDPVPGPSPITDPSPVEVPQPMEIPPVTPPPFVDPPVTSPMA